MAAVEDDFDLAIRDPRFRASVLAVAWALACHADWQEMATRPGWARLCQLAGRSRSTVASVLAWMHSRGLLCTIEFGTTQEVRGGLGWPHVDPHAGEGNRGAEYLLCVPVPQPAAPYDHGPGEDQAPVVEAAHEHENVAHDHGQAPAAVPDAGQDVDQVADQEIAGLGICLGPLPPEALPTADEEPTRAHTRERERERAGEAPPSDSDKEHYERTKDSSTRSGVGSVRPLSECPPSGRWTQRARLRAAEALREASPVFRLLSARCVRSQLTPWWRAGWSSTDVLVALDRMPDGTRWSTGFVRGEVRNPAAWITYRLNRWTGPDGTPLASHGQLKAAAAERLRAEQETRRAHNTAAEAERAVHGRLDQGHNAARAARAALAAIHARTGKSARVAEDRRRQARARGERGDDLVRYGL